VFSSVWKWYYRATRIGWREALQRLKDFLEG